MYTCVMRYSSVVDGEDPSLKAGAYARSATPPAPEYQPGMFIRLILVGRGLQTPTEARGGLKTPAYTRGVITGCYGKERESRWQLSND